jgi:hypothetical protein
VAAHPLHVPVSEKNPSGITIQDGHCRSNPSGKDQIYTQELARIAEKHFGRIKKLPTPDDLGSDDGNKYDRLIAGWTRYWNEVLAPSEPLDSNLVKALIKTESEFDKEAKVRIRPGNFARGLMQITDETIKILKDEKGELKEYLVNIDQDDAFDPNLNIAAGTRWLFHKKHLLEKRLRRTVTWEEAVMEYKAYTRDLKKRDKSALRQREKFLTLYRRLKK